MITMSLYTEGDQPISFSNIQEAIVPASQGDSRAWEEIDGYFRPRLIGSLRRRLGFAENGEYGIEDLTQEALIALHQGLSKFKIHQGNVEKTLMNYCFTVARRTHYANTRALENQTELMKLFSEDLALANNNSDLHTDDHAQQLQNPTDQLFSSIKSVLAGAAEKDKYVVPRKMDEMARTLALRTAGKTKDQIAREMSISPSLVGRYVFIGRNIFEGEVFDPKGYRRISRERPVTDVVSRASGQAINFLGMTYQKS